MLYVRKGKVFQKIYELMLSKEMITEIRNYATVTERNSHILQQ